MITTSFASYHHGHLTDDPHAAHTGSARNAPLPVRGAARRDHPRLRRGAEVLGTRPARRAHCHRAQIHRTLHSHISMSELLLRELQDEFRATSDEVPMELTLQMGRCVLRCSPLHPTDGSAVRPVSQVPGEVRGFLDRAEYMLSIAERSLADVPLTDTDKPGFRRYIKRVPQGVVLVIAPWKYVQPPCPILRMLTIHVQLPLPRLHQLRAPRPHRRQLRPPQAFSPDPAHRRTFRSRPHPRRRPRRCYTGYPPLARAHCTRRATPRRRLCFLYWQRTGRPRR